ncbi:MAG: Gfo/Idh/MocA family oxidoreductase [Erysipelotrichaceae bacterium]|nr:Gfo/Idh/MocA family oxidoreductase [Erysipelotrichaceae bacterium]
MIRFGILGPGKISHRFVKGMKDVSGAKITAAASRDFNKAEEFCELYQIEKAYGSYEEMLKDKDVDAVYIATPPFVHKEQIMMCLKAGKHVLCEKPLMKTSKEARECFDLAKGKGLLLMEATKGVFTPTFLKIKELMEEGTIGKVSYLEASYCYDGKFDENHWVMHQNLAGGGMYDVGIYPLSAIVGLLGTEMTELKRMDLACKDCLGMTQLLIKYNDVMASVRGAITVATDNTFRIYGDIGSIECEHFWKGHDLSVKINDHKEFYHFDFESEFTFEIQHFVECIQKGLSESPVLSEEVSCFMLDVMDEKKTWM